jgi:hypothetical protein
MIRRFFILISILLFFQTSWCQTLGFSLADGKKKAQIPIEINNNLVVVPVVLNGMLPLKFIVDTGVRTAILTQKTFSDILNLSYSRKYTISGPGGVKVVDAFVTNNVSLELPGVIGRGHALLVLEEDYLELRNYLGTDVHGILGYELFSRFIVEINYDKKVMTLTVPERFKKPRRFHTVPIRIEDTKPYATTQIHLASDTVMEAKLLVDSGASHGLMLEPTSHPLITVPEHAVSSVIGRGLGGEITGKVGRITSLKLGPYKLHRAIANFPDPNSYMDSLKMGSTPRHGAIGGEVLSRFTVIFNFPKEEMYVKKNSSFRKKFYYNLSGLTIKAKGSALDIFEVTSVRDQSAGSRAGLMEGDLVTTLNGISTRLLDLNIVNGIFNSKPGKKVNVEITRNGVRMKKQLILKDQI